jgi:hypothetical protein
LQRAKTVLQISTYQHLINIFGISPTYLLLNAAETEKFEEILKRTLALMEAFVIDKLNPNSAAQFYLAAAQGYSMQGNKEKTLDMLDKYAQVCTSGFFPIELHGDSYFDRIDDWFNEFDLGSKPPRDEKIIKESMIQAITANPAFSAMTEEPKYKSIIEKMKQKLEV